MQILEGPDVNTIWPQALELILTKGVRRSSRNGTVFVLPEPVTTVYTQPQRRVLFDKDRDANPFFHLHEALWMLAGHEDAASLEPLLSNVGQRYAEQNGMFHGAYGHRWRWHFAGMDQLKWLITKLTQDTNDRRIVLQMWDPYHDMDVNAKDIPCNTNIYFRADNGVLDMTVCCRSNDLIWGCYGANVVHMSMLQEFVAASLHMKMGTYCQMSNNWHAYESSLAPLMLKHTIQMHRGAIRWHADYANSAAQSSPLVGTPSEFLTEVEQFVTLPCAEREYRNKFLHEVARPMYVLGTQWRDLNDSDMRDYLSNMPWKNDWAMAARDWLERRGRLK